MGLEMHRLFAAIRPPQHVREHLLGLIGGVSGARWQSDEQLHLTLRFIGEVEARVAEDVAAALASVRQQRFEIFLNGIGSFERRGQPEVLWAGVAPHDQLKVLHKKVDQACQRAGLPPEGRAYTPHITLARLKRGAGPIASLIETSGGLSSKPFPVESFCLYESQLTPDGAVYSIVERYALA
jgi:RNA 2',3'-cyclic 3'-phosphodiesterase